MDFGSAYRDAQFKARARAGSLSQASAEAIEREIRAHAERLSAAIAQFPSDKQVAIEASRRLLVDAAETLHTKLTKAIAEKRDLAFGELLEVWQRAGATALSAAGVVPSTLLGGVAVPQITLAGAYANLGGAHHWRTRLQGYVQNSVQDADRIVRQALLDGMGVEELARRLRPYVAGAAPFHERFGEEAFAELRNLQGAGPLRDAAKKLRGQAHRIAYSEVWNARAEAELTHYAVDPLIEAVKWNLSRFRGALDGPDICDALAVNDFYGLGPGVYPLAFLPSPPHPYDRCEREPVMRAPARAHLPKPHPVRLLGASNAKLYADGGAPGARALSLAAADRIRTELSVLLAMAESDEASLAVKQLMASVDPAAVQAAFASVPPRRRGAA